MLVQPSRASGGRTTPASRRPNPQRTLHKDRKGGDLFLFTHLTVERCPFLFICRSHTHRIPRGGFLFFSTCVSASARQSRAQCCASEYLEHLECSYQPHIQVRAAHWQNFYFRSSLHINVPSTTALPVPSPGPGVDLERSLPAPRADYVCHSGSAWPREMRRLAA